MMDAWIALWKVVLIVAGGLFAGMVVVCGIRGAFDLRDLFRMLRR